MQKPESVSENETHKILWDFDLQTDHQMLARLSVNLQRGKTPSTSVLDMTLNSLMVKLQ